MRYRVPEFVLGVLATVSVFMLGFLAASPMPVSPARVQQAAQKYAGGNRESEQSETVGQALGGFFVEIVSDPINLFTLWIALFTAVVAVATIRLNRATLIAANAGKIAAVVAKKALTDLERPYVYVSVVEPGIEMPRLGGQTAGPP